jgi:Helicase HerA, central domain
VFSQSANAFFNSARYQNNPLNALITFLEKEKRNEMAHNIAEMKFVGYVLDIGYDSATIITSDPFKKAVGGVPKGSFLILAPETLNDLPPHFTLLRVTDTAPTPLNMQVQQTYFELHKKSMPELDIWTQSELQWGALKCSVLGMFYPDPEDTDQIQFSGDVNNILSAHRYLVYAPDNNLLKIIINGTLKDANPYKIGNLRLTECKLASLLFSNESDKQMHINMPVNISIKDFKGTRTAMFGKTRLGKSNVVKLIVQAIINATKDEKTVGQLIFDTNGEYANDNPQDGNKSIRSSNEDQCNVYALTKREDTPSKPLRLNFFEHPDSCMKVLASMLEQDNKTSNYIRSFANIELASINSIASLPEDEKTRPVRKIQIYWAILHEAGFLANENALKKLGLRARHAKDFSPHFNKELREAAYRNDASEDSEGETPTPDHPHNLDELVRELKIMAKFKNEDPDNPNLLSGSKNARKPIFDAEERALLDFLSPKSGTGPGLLSAYKKYHSSDASDFVKEILGLLDQGKTIMLDLGNASDTIRRYFSDLISQAIFSHQEHKFVGNALGNHFVQLYFEEAHNLFPVDSKDLTGVYARFAKEGAKFHIGMVYSTQSPSTINKELLVQTENFFVGHLSSQEETKSLSKLQILYSGLEEEIMRSRTPGFMRMLTRSHRFVIPVQTNKFTA